MRSITFVLPGLAIFATFSAPAIDEQRLSITVNVVKPPCTLNGGQNINVDFGNEVITTRIDGVYKKQKIDYKPGGCLTTKLKLRVSGQPAAWDTGLLGSNNEALGIKFLNSGSELKLNNWINFNSPSWPVLEAVLVKNNKANLKSGPFTASATIMLDYD